MVDMYDMKRIIAKNITELRMAKGMTQLQVAEKLNYSDKAVSKWERAESIPDVVILKEIADLFDVTLDYLVEEKHSKVVQNPIVDESVRKRKQIDIMSLSVALVWFVATLIFVILDLTTKIMYAHMLPFVYAIPVSAIVWLVFNSIWFSKRTNYIIISILVWSTLLAFYLTFYVFGIDIKMLFLVGIPGQLIIFMWSMLGKRK